MLKRNFFILAVTLAVLPTGAYAAPLNPDRHPPESKPAVEQELARHGPLPRPRLIRRKRRKPHASHITIVL